MKESLLTVLWLEDYEGTRNSMLRSLKNKYLDLNIFASSEEMAQWIAINPDKKIDIVVTDYDVCEDLTGPEFVYQTFETQIKSGNAPKFFVYSATHDFQNEEDVKKLKATCVDKTENQKILAYIRLAYLQRLLSSDNEELVWQLSRIATTASSRINAVSRALKHVGLIIQEVLRTPTVFMVSNEKENIYQSIEVVIDKYELNLTPEEIKIFENVNAAAKDYATSRPLADKNVLFALDLDQERIQIINGGHLMSSRYNDERVTLLLLQGAQNEHYIETIAKLLTPMDYYNLMLPVMGQVLIDYDSAACAAPDVARFLAYFSMGVHHEVQQRLVTAGIEKISPVNFSAECIVSFNEKLKNTAEYLANKLDKKTPDGLPIKVNLLNLLNDVISGIIVPDNLLFNLPASDDVLMLREGHDLDIALGYILMWFALRVGYHNPERKFEISIWVERDGDYLKVCLQDGTKRAPSRYREILFDPFLEGTKLSSLIKKDNNGEAVEGERGLLSPLYVSRIIIESLNNGMILDKSDDLGFVENSYAQHGHRFVIHFYQPIN